MRRRASSSSEDTEEPRPKLHPEDPEIRRHRSEGEFSYASTNGGSTSGLSTSHLSPRWGEPGRKLPSVLSMLQLPPAAVPVSQPAESVDIEDFGKDDTQSENNLLIDELVQASPRVQVDFAAADSLCPRCHRPACPVSRPPPGYYSERDVAKHRTPGDCWIMAHGFVYDVSRYLTKHPGGPRAILGRAGQDASQDFDFHTKCGKNIWKRLQVGRVAKCNATLPDENQGECTIS